MMTARDARLAHLRHEIVRRSHAGLDTWTLRTETLSLLRRLMPIDAVWWALADPHTLLFTQALTDQVPTSAAPLFLENELLHEDVNKFALLARGPHPVSTLYEATQGQPERSARFRDILRPHRLGDELRVAVRDRRHSWGFMCLHRDAGGRAFSREEQLLLRQLGPHLAAGLRQSLLLTRGETTGGPSVPGVLIVTAGLKRVSISASAEAWLAEVDDWPRLGVRSLAIVAVVSRLLAIERTPPDAPDPLPRIRVQTRTGRWLTLSASRLAQASGGNHIAIIVEPARAEDIVSLLLAAHALTDNQEKIARCVLQGFSNREIAQTLSITPLTVQQHLKGVFEKLNVHSRGELLARLHARHSHGSV